MTEETLTQIRSEGDPAFGEDSGDNTSSESSTENNENGDGQSSDGQQGANSQDDPDKDKPFHQHPRWTEREKEWDKRFNDQETRHQEDLRKIREEFSTKKQDNAEQTEIPSWFGGTKEQWDAYRKDRDAEITAAEDRAIKRVTEAKETESKAVQEATAYMQTELAAIEKDTTLNPSGAKIDPNKLLKFVLDNDLVDSQGRWNYKAGFKMMQAGSKPAPKPGDRKEVAGATTSEPKAETKPAPFKTSKDFKNKRPW